MRVSIKAVGLASATLWGLGMLLVGLINMAAPSYGTAFLHLLSSVYPGADTAPTLGFYDVSPAAPTRSASSA